MITAVRRGRIDLGEDVVVIGAGLLGLIVFQLAKVSGVGGTIAVGRGHGLEIAGLLGAEEKVDREQGNVVRKGILLDADRIVLDEIEVGGSHRAPNPSVSPSSCLRLGELT